jgi:hypothetical protein
LVYALERELAHFVSLEIADRVRELHVGMIFHGLAAELEDARIRESLRNDSVSHYETYPITNKSGAASTVSRHFVLCAADGRCATPRMDQARGGSSEAVKTEKQARR